VNPIDQGHYERQFRNAHNAHRGIAMIIHFSAELMDDLVMCVHAAMHKNGIVNISTLAEEVRKRHESENVALEDIEMMAMKVGQRFSCAMLLDGTALVSMGAESIDRGNGANGHHVLS
jgi:hypothetical protein